MKNQNKMAATRHIFLIFVLLFTIAPIALLFMNSVKPSGEFLANPFGLPTKLQFNNIAKAWVQGNYAISFRNSIIVAAASVLIVDVFGGLAAYGLAKMKFRGSGAVMVYFLLAVSIPLGLFLVPLFYIWQKIHLMDSLLGLILIYSAIYLPFNVFFLRSFFINIPNELRESATIDGCNEWQVFWKIIVPLAKPAFLTSSLLVTLWTWNEFFFANAFIQSDNLRTVATRYLTFTGQFSSDWSMICAAGLIAIVPIMVVYLFFQRNFIEGLTSGSVKG